MSNYNSKNEKKVVEKKLSETDSRSFRWVKVGNANAIDPAGSANFPENETKERF